MGSDRLPPNTPILAVFALHLSAEVFPQILHGVRTVEALAFE